MQTGCDKIIALPEWSESKRNDTVWANHVNSDRE